MKKLVTIIALALALILSLTACGGSRGGGDDAAAEGGSNEGAKIGVATANPSTAAIAASAESTAASTSCDPGWTCRSSP